MKNECDQIRDLIADSVTVTLPPREATYLEEHLRECADCRSCAEGLKQEDLLLAQLVAGVATNVPDRQERLLQALGRRQFGQADHPAKWRRIMRSRIARLAAAAIVVLVAALGISLLEKSSTPAYGMTEALDLIEQARTLHIQGWSLGRSKPDAEQIRLPFERWYDLQNGYYREEYGAQDHDGTVRRDFEVCDGQYVMRGTLGRQPVGQKARPTIFFERVDPNRRANDSLKKWAEYRLLHQIEGFRKIRQDMVDGKRFDLWQGESVVGVGDSVGRNRLEVWLSPATADVGRTRYWHEEEGGWTQVSEYTRFEWNVPLSPELFLTEPPATGYEIANSKETATVPVHTDWLEQDLYEDTQFAYASLNYRLSPAFALPNGVLLAGYRSVDGQESRDQSRYFEGLRPGGPSAKLPVEVYALSPEPNVRHVLFTAFHLAYTQKETSAGRRWFEWILYVPDREPPKPDAVLQYRIIYRRNVQRTEDIDIRFKQISLPDPQRIETEEDFNRLVLDAIAERSDGGVVPEQVTYEHVLRIAEGIRASIAR